MHNFLEADGLSSQQLYETMNSSLPRGMLRMLRYVDESGRWTTLMLTIMWSQVAAVIFAPTGVRSDLCSCF